MGNSVGLRFYLAKNLDTRSYGEIYQDELNSLEELNKYGELGGTFCPVYYSSEEIKEKARARAIKIAEEQGTDIIKSVPCINGVPDRIITREEGFIKWLT